MLRRSAAALAILLIAPAAAMAQGTSWELRPLGRLSGLVDLHIGARSDVIVAETLVGPVGLRFERDGTLRRVSPPEHPAMPPDVLPQSRCAIGGADIRLACLTGPTRRYDHAVLGDAIEAEAVSVRRADGGWSHYRLGRDAVFEDLTPRLADLDGDGRDDVVVVKTVAGLGASLAVLGLEGDRLRLSAESEAIGRSYRWLNPVGTGDFDGDGNIEIAVVRTPHIGGVLMIYRPDAPRLALAARMPGFCNHRMGSTVLGMAAIADFDGDGLVDILLPRQDRAGLSAISFAGGRLRQIDDVDLEAQIETSMVLVDIEGDDRPDVVFGLAGGQLVALMR